MTQNIGKRKLIKAHGILKKKTLKHKKINNNILIKVIFIVKLKNSKI